MEAWIRILRADQLSRKRCHDLLQASGSLRTIPPKFLSSPTFSIADSHKLLIEIRRCGRKSDPETPIERAGVLRGTIHRPFLDMEADMTHLFATLLLCIGLIQGCSTLSEGRGSAASTSPLY